MTNYQHGDSAVAVAVKMAAPVGVSGLSLFGVHLEAWILIGTFIFTILLIVEKLWSMWSRWKKERESED